MASGPIAGVVGKLTWSEQRFVDSLAAPWFQTLVLAQDAVSACAHRFFRSRGLVTLNLPVTTGAVSSPMGVGSDSQPVHVKIGECETYLSDSMQFFLEYGCRLHKQGCFYLMPSFRGDSVDETHLAQFHHCEAEIPGQLSEALALAQDFLREVSGDIAKTLTGIVGDEHLQHLSALADGTTPFAQITHADAVGLLSGQTGALRTIAGGSRVVTRSGELVLIAEHGCPVWLAYPPADTVPFYQARCERDRSLAASADLLMGIGEVIGAGERHVEYEEAEAALREHGVGAEDYRWYLRLKDLRPLQTSGFGMGVERLLCWALKQDDVRNCEVIARRNGEVLEP